MFFKEKLVLKLFLFSVFCFLNLLSENVILKDGSTTYSVDSKYIVQTTKEVNKLINDLKKVDISAIKNIRGLNTKYPTLESLRRKIPGFKNIRKFELLLSHCQKLVNLRKDIKKRADEYISILKAGGLEGSPGEMKFSIKIPDENAKNEIIKKATGIYNNLSKYSKKAANFDSYISKKDLLSQKKYIDDLKINELFKKIVALIKNYEKSIKTAKGVVKKGSDVISGYKGFIKTGRIEERDYKSEIEKLKREIDSLNGTIEAMNRKGVLGEEDIKELEEKLEKTSKLVGENSEIINKIKEEKVEAYEKTLKALKVMREGKQKEKLKEVLQTESEKKYEEFENIIKEFEKTKKENYFAWINELKESFEDLSERLKKIEGDLQSAKATDLINKTQKGLFKKLKENALEKIKKSELAIEDYKKSFNLKKDSIKKNLMELKKYALKVSSMQTPSIDFGGQNEKVFFEKQDKELEKAKKAKKELDRYLDLINTLRPDVSKNIQDLVNKIKKLENDVKDVSESVKVSVLDEKDKEFIQKKLTDIIQEESKRASLPYKFVLRRETYYSEIPKNWYVEAGKPDPDIEVYLEIKDSKFIEKIENIKFEEEKNLKNVYLKLLAGELHKKLKENLLDKDIAYVYNNVIIKNPYKEIGKRGSGKPDSIQSVLINIFEPFVQDFNKFFTINILDLGIILTHIKSRQIDKDKVLRDEQASGLSVLRTFNRVINNKTTNLEEIRFYINGLRINPSFGFKDNKFFRFRTLKGPKFFNTELKDGPYPIIHKVPLIFALGGYYDFGNDIISSHFKEISVDALIKDTSLISRFQDLIDSFYRILQTTLNIRFAVEKIKALYNLKDVFLLSDINNFESLNSQIKNLFVIYNLTVDNNKELENIRKNLEEKTVSVKEIIDNIKEVLNKKESVLKNDEEDISKQLEDLRNKLEELNDFIIKGDTNKEKLDNSIEGIKKDLISKIKNKHGVLNEEQNKLLKKINKLKELFKDKLLKDLQLSGRKLDDITKESIISYFRKGKGVDKSLEYYQKITNDVFFKKIASIPNLFLYNFFDINNFQTSRLKKTGVLSFLKYNSRLSPPIKLFTQILSRLSNKSDLLEKFKYENIYGFLECCGLILTQLNVSYELNDPNQFFNKSSYSGKFVEERSKSFKKFDVKPSKKLQNDLDFISKDMSYEGYYSKYKKIFISGYPSPKYFLNLAKNYFEKNDFENMTKAFFRYFYISNEWYQEKELRLFDLEENVFIEKKEQQETGKKREKSGSVPPPAPSSGIPPAPSSGIPAAPSLGIPAASGLGLSGKDSIPNKNINDMTLKDLKNITDEEFIETYENDKETLKKFYVNRFYLTIFNFLKLIIKTHIKIVSDTFENLKRGSFITGIYDDEISDFNIKNQQINVFRYLSRISDLNDFVQALRKLNPTLKIDKNNILTLTYKTDYKFKEELEKILVSLTKSLNEKYKKNIENKQIYSTLIKPLKEKLNEYLESIYKFENLRIDLKEHTKWVEFDKKAIKEIKKEEETTEKKVGEMKKTTSKLRKKPTKTKRKGQTTRGREDTEIKQKNLEDLSIEELKESLKRCEIVVKTIEFEIEKIDENIKKLEKEKGKRKIDLKIEKQKRDKKIKILEKEKNKIERVKELIKEKEQEEKKNN
ncbi:hypothetical protein GF385_00005 [Candidatus Dependentiae bacterium]|nr:hypothetical protein [Candidatus Dependentiae bacterium]